MDSEYSRHHRHEGYIERFCRPIYETIFHGYHMRNTIEEETAIVAVCFETCSNAIRAHSKDGISDERYREWFRLIEKFGRLSKKDCRPSAPNASSCAAQ